MPQERRRPPTQDRRRFGNVVSAISFDVPKNSHSPYIPQGRRLLRQLGPGERAVARACHERGFRVIEGGRP